MNSRDLEYYQRRERQERERAARAEGGPASLESAGRACIGEAARRNLLAHEGLSLRRNS